MSTDRDNAPVTNAQLAQVLLQLSASIIQAQKEAVDKVLRGLKPSTRRELEIRRPEDVDTAIRQADVLESCSFDTSYRNNNNSGFNNNNRSCHSNYNRNTYKGNNDNRGDPMEIDAIQQRNGNNNSSSTGSAKPWGVWNPATNQNMKDEYTKNGRCFRCGLHGHQSNNPDCPRPRDATRTAPVKRASSPASSKQ